MHLLLLQSSYPAIVKRFPDLNSLIICDLNFPFLRTSPKLKQVCFWFQFVVSCFAGRRIENRGAKATQLTAEERRRLKTTNVIEQLIFWVQIYKDSDKQTKELEESFSL